MTMNCLFFLVVVLDSFSFSHVQQQAKKKTNGDNQDYMDIEKWWQMLARKKKITNEWMIEWRPIDHYEKY